eukprot:snap_masked-scaffold_26-processed-gene-0.19-mRNA-1 protein AED:1.00 eAED:1.00 QI:0/-1/0/0/-1/1/1/0/76
MQFQNSVSKELIRKILKIKKWKISFSIFFVFSHSPDAEKLIVHSQRIQMKAPKNMSPLLQKNKNQHIIEQKMTEDN